MYVSYLSVVELIISLFRWLIQQCSTPFIVHDSFLLVLHCQPEVDNLHLGQIRVAPNEQVARLHVSVDDVLSLVQVEQALEDSPHDQGALGLRQGLPRLASPGEEVRQTLPGQLEGHHVVVAVHGQVVDLDYVVVVQLLEDGELVLKHAAVVYCARVCLVHYLQCKFLALLSVDGCDDNSEPSIAHDLYELIQI